MRLPFRPLALLGAALLLGPGCKTSSSSAPPASASTSTPAPADPWHAARVGDSVTYAFSAHRGGGEGRGGEPRTLAGQVTLRVVAVQAPWVWLELAFHDEAGAPLAQTRLARPLVLPVRMDETHPIEVAPLGEPTPESPTLAGRAWSAQRYVKDNRPSDGNLVSRAYAVEPGPLYLTRGLLDAVTESAGFHVPGGLTLSLRGFEQGQGPATAAPPPLERPLGPGTWYDRRLEQEPTPQLLRVCFGAERGYLLRTEGPLDPQTEPCAHLTDAEAEPLEEVLMGLAWEALNAGDWPPPSEATSGVKGTFSVEGHDVPSLGMRRDIAEQGVRRVYAEEVAADPWGPALAGLAREARFQVLSERTERVEKNGQHVPEGGSRLVRWGTWLDGAK
jgi:hypothetical protein